MSDIKTQCHTYGIPGLGSLDGLNKWTETKSVLSTDTEQVLVSLIQVWNH